MEWINKYIGYWNSQDIEGIKSLFHRNYTYIDMPFEGPLGIEDVMYTEWNRPSKNANMQLRFFASDGNKCAARVIYYRAHHGNTDGTETITEPKYSLYTKIMLFELNDFGRCTYLYEMQSGKTWGVEEDQDPDESIKKIPEYF